MHQKMKVMQLPPLPEDSSGKLVGLIWDCLKLTTKNPELLDEFSKRLALRNKTDILTDLDISITPIEDAQLEEITQFRENMQSVLATVVAETCSMTRYVYIQCFVNKRTVNDLISENPTSKDIILKIYGLLLAEERETEGTINA